MFYLIRTPWWLKKLYPAGIWSGSDPGSVYLTFDDGPHPRATPFVLETLRKYRIQATFFCIGKNVEAHREIYRQILDDGHQTGNHTQHHLNGWKTSDKVYLDDIEIASKYIDSKLFRPPYGKITPFQMNQLAAPKFKMKCIMWTLLSGDFDKDLSPQKCLERIVVNVKGGDIVVFHDSEKAFERLEFSLPGFIEFCLSKGLHFKTIL